MWLSRNTKNEAVRQPGPSGCPRLGGRSLAGEPCPQVATSCPAQGWREKATRAVLLQRHSPFPGSGPVSWTMWTRAGTWPEGKQPPDLQVPHRGALEGIQPTWAFKFWACLFWESEWDSQNKQATPRSGEDWVLCPHPDQALKNKPSYKLRCHHWSEMTIVLPSPTCHRKEHSKALRTPKASLRLVSSLRAAPAQAKSWHPAEHACTPSAPGPQPALTTIWLPQNVGLL